MPHRKGISVMVLLGQFQKFDHGKEIVQHEDGLNLTTDDTFHWHCAQFDGIAKVLDYKNGKLSFVKLFLD